MEEHIALDGRLIEIFIICSNRIVGQVYELIADFLRIVIDCREADVAFIVHPDDERVEVSNEHPLPYIELSLQDDKRVFDVFLGDP